MTIVPSTPERYLIDPVAFFLALLGGPLLFTVAFFWLLFVPVFALFVGGLPYLLLGTPVLLIYLRRHPANAGDVAWLAFLTFLLGWVLLAIFFTLSTSVSSAKSLIWLLLFGGFFAPCWGASFAWTYIALARSFFTQPRPI